MLVSVKRSSLFCLVITGTVFTFAGKAVVSPDQVEHLVGTLVTHKDFTRTKMFWSVKHTSLLGQNVNYAAKIIFRPSISSRA